MKTKERIFVYCGWANTLDFAESLGFKDVKNWEDIEQLDPVLDELEADSIQFIERQGYTVKGYDD
jgi:hypothetical protein